jgi:hypothetical protein
MASSGRVKEPKLAHLDKVFYKWFTPMHSKEKPMIGPMIIEKAKCFYDEMKIADECTLRAVTKKIGL